MIIQEILQKGTEFLQASGNLNARMEAQMILSEVTGKTKEWFVTHFDEVISEKESEAFYTIIEKRAKGEPLQYLLGYTYFMGLRFLVNENVLIPRADTEILVESVIQRIEKEKKVKLLDLCTGSGCIAISLKKYLEKAEIFASDISKKALETAKKNAFENQVAVEFILSDRFQKIPDIKFDAIVSNPPYLTESEMTELQKEVMYEPKLALAGGRDGLDFYREIAEKAKTYLRDGGILAFEIGFRQADAVSAVLSEQNYREIEVLKDYSGNQRVVISKKITGGIHESN